jgi:hypothetical protein
MTIPAVPLPQDGSVRTPVDFKLKPGWRFVSRSCTFESDTGETFSPRGDLPEGSRIVYKVPNLARADASKLNEHEKELRRYMQLILPQRTSAAKYQSTVRGWPCVEDSHAGPEVSLPQRL